VGRALRFWAKAVVRAEVSGAARNRSGVREFPRKVIRGGRHRTSAQPHGARQSHVADSRFVEVGWIRGQEDCDATAISGGNRAKAPDMRVRCPGPAPCPIPERTKYLWRDSRDDTKFTVSTALAWLARRRARDRASIRPWANRS
jgi:hypothetical protein